MSLKKAAILVSVTLSKDRNNSVAHCLESQELLAAAGYECVFIVKLTQSHVNSASYLSVVHAGYIKDVAACVKPHLIVIDQTLKPGHLFTLQRLISGRLMDRSELILLLFAQRARSHEGKLQVHLAQLEFERTHLVNRWSHLERQKGSISTRGGPGEKQLELDKRYLEQKISAHKKSLAKVINKRSLSRRARQRSGKKMVALVGYTNAGKSTLFNQLTHSNAYADDQVFATLDPTIRRMHSSGESNILFSDTVGFIRDLPKGLLDAFKSTLEEINQACLILHVLDLSDPQHTYYEQVTADVLEKIGVTDIPCIKVYNKLDLVSGHTAFYADRTDRFSKNACWMTAQSPQDIQDLATLVEANVNGQKIIKTLHLNLTQAALKAYCYRCGWVKEAEAHDQGWKLTLELTQNQWRRILRRVIV